MPTPTYDLLDSQVLSTSAASVTFSSIPATYRDLVLVVEVSASSASAIVLRINSDTGNNYSNVRMGGNGSTTVSSTQTTSFFSASSYGTVGTDKSTVIWRLLDYSATDKHKSALCRFDRASTGVTATASRWANTAAITALELNTLGNPDFAIGSTFYLYGISS